MTRPATRLRPAARARSAISTGQEGAGRATVSQPVQPTSPAIVATARTGRRSSPAVRAITTIQARLTHRNARIPSDSTARPRSASDGPRPDAPPGVTYGLAADPALARGSASTGWSRAEARAAATTLERA